MRRILIFTLASLLALSFSSVKAQTTSSQSTAVLIQQLQEQIKSLQAQVSSLVTQLNAVKVELNLTRTLRPGLTGDDVKQLQEFLKTIPGVYPEGLVTGYFGPLTKAAIQRFQEKQGIVNTGSSETTGYGVVGPRTISKINELISTGAGASGVIPPGLAPAGSTLPITPAVTGFVVPQTQTSVPSQTQTTSIAPTQSVTTTSNTTSGAATTTSAAASTSSTATSSTTTSSTSALPTPQNFSMTGGVEAVTATWSLVDNTTVTGYKILLTNTGANTTSVFTTNGGTKKIFDGIAPGDYSAYIATFDAAGNTSAPSPTAYATASSPSTSSYPPEVTALGKYTGFNGGGYGEDSTWCYDSNYGVSMWNDTAGTCRDKTGSYTDFCRASPYEWQKSGYGCTGDVTGTAWNNVRCTIGNGGFTGGSCSAGVISSAPPSPPPPSSTTTRAALQASILSSLNSLLLQLYELVR